MYALCRHIPILNMRSTSQAAMIFIFISVLIDTTGFGLIFPVLPELIQQLIQGDISTAATYGGWLAFAFAVTQFLFAPLLGNLSDRFGRRPVLLACLAAFGINYLFMALAGSIFWLFIGRIVAGLTGASYTIAYAYIADISTPEKKSQNFGMVGAAFGAGFIIGPVMGGLLGHYGIRAPFYAAAALSLLNVLYGYFFLPESLTKDKRRPFELARANPIGSLTQIKRFPSVIGLIACLMLLYLAGHSMETCWAFFTMEKFHWDERMVGYSLGAFGLIGAIVQGGLIRIIIPKIGDRVATYVGIGLNAICMLAYALVPEAWMVFALAIVDSFTTIGNAALEGLISNQVPENEQGELQGSKSSLTSLMVIISPPIMTGLFAFFTRKDAPIYLPGAPFILASGLTLIAFVIAYRTLRRLPEPQHTQAPEPALAD